MFYLLRSGNIGSILLPIMPPSGQEMPRINKILKSIEQEYVWINAYLMDIDSLCQNCRDNLNVTVLGYAKDEIFDVNDSLFFG